VISIFINIGMWFERYVIIVSSLSHEYAPWAWGIYKPSIVEMAILFGSFCWFGFWFLLFVRVWTLVGGLTGAATGLAFTTWTSMDWPLVVGGKPIVSIPPYVIIIFELMVLFGALATIIGLFVLSRLPNVKPAIIYDPEFTAGRYGVYVEAPSDRLAEARRILEAEEPLELREGEVSHA
jgi:hypothetical protein